MAYLGLDLSEVEASKKFDLLPEGEYTGMIVEADVVDSKSNASNKRLTYTFEISNGQYKGRRVFNGLNILHSNKETEMIAKADLASLCDAINISRKVQNTDDLRSKPFIAKIGIKPPKDGYDAQNVIKSVKSLKSGGVPAAVKNATVAPVSSAAPVASPVYQSNDTDDEVIPF